MSFILKLIKGLGLLGGLFALMYAGLLVLTGPAPRYNIIVPEVTDDLVRFCNENAGVRVFRPLEGVKSISSDIGSICLRRHKRFFLSSSLETIEFNEGPFLGGADCPEGRTPKRGGWHRYDKVERADQETPSASSADAAPSGRDRLQIRFEAIELPSSRYHVHYYRDPPVRYDEKRALIKSGVAMHDKYTDERIGELRNYRVSPRREHYQPIVAFFRIEPLYTPLKYEFPCDAGISVGGMELLEVMINSNHTERKHVR